jgi:hypothetical protein
MLQENIPLVMIAQSMEFSIFEVEDFANKEL